MEMNRRTHILYVSCLCAPKIIEKLMELDNKSIGQQVQKYHRLLVEGLSKNGSSVKALSFHKELYRIADINLFESLDRSIDYCYIKEKIKNNQDYIKVFRNAYKETINYLRQYEDAVVICDVLNFTVSLGAVLAARKMKREVVGIITDFPEFLFGSNYLAVRLYWFLINRCTSYLVMTEQMKEHLSNKKRSLVMEGVVDINMAKQNVTHKTPQKKICIYAGLLHRKYGIETLVKAFTKANVDGTELYLYGTGDYEEELKKLDNNRIKYMGVKANADIVEAEQNAFLLINPRPTNQEFTKYSFPSKNMEYMVSGTPVLTTRLPGMPLEYERYVYLFDEETIDGMSDKLREVLTKDKSELSSLGSAARQFVLAEKNNVVQTRKILQFIEQKNI